MKIKEAIGQMSIMFLDRVVQSFMKESVKKDEDHRREEILNNIETLVDAKDIEERLKVDHEKVISDITSGRALLLLILRTVLLFEDLRADEMRLVEAVKEQEKRIVEEAKMENAFGHLDERSFDIFRVILGEALNNEMKVSPDEENLLSKVQTKLSISDRDRYMIQSYIGLFPKKDNELHTTGEIQKGLAQLQRCGVLFFCNQPRNNNEESFFVIPDEVSRGVKAMMGIELVDNKFRLLLQGLTTNDLSNILDEKGLRVGGKKEERIERILWAGIKPSEVLGRIDVRELREFCGKLPGLTKSGGKKSDKVQEIIDHYDSLINKEKIEGNDQRETYYNFFEQLASRDYSNLRGQEVVQKDVEIDGAFEKATHYLFTNICGFRALHMEGKNTPDGMLKDPTNEDELLLWDNKSQEGPYTFPESHKKQFGDYISKYKKKGYRIKSFLIITQSIDDSAQKNARLLKNRTDVDVALISAEDLKYVAENWKKDLNIDSFNDTGIITRDALDRVMEWV